MQYLLFATLYKEIAHNKTALDICYLGVKQRIENFFVFFRVLHDTFCQ